MMTGSFKLKDKLLWSRFEGGGTSTEEYKQHGTENIASLLLRLVSTMSAAGVFVSAASPWGVRCRLLITLHGTIRVLTFGSGGVPASHRMPGGRRVA